MAPEPVHLAGPAELLSVLALPALAPLTADGVLLRVTTGLADDLLEGLQSRFDVVLSAVRPRGRALSAVPLTDEEFVLVAAPEWARRIGPSPSVTPVRCGTCRSSRTRRTCRSCDGTGGTSSARGSRHGPLSSSRICGASGRRSWRGPV
ncbi:LysR substrate-binding domain-containing protein [Streptomyces thermocarboxydus]